jgi:copper transport protein
VILTAIHTLIRSVELLALLASAGGALFLTTAMREERLLAARLQPGLLLLAGLAGVTAFLDVGLHGMALAAEGRTGLPGGQAWLAGLASSRGLADSIIIFNTGIVLLAVAAHHAASARIAGISGAALAALALAVGSEASLDDPPWLSFATVLLHGLASLVLVGAVWPLVVTLTTQPTETCARILRSVLPGLVLAMALVLSTGILLTPSGVSEPDAVIRTPYGRLWIAKVFLSTVLLALSARLTLHGAARSHRLDADRYRTRRLVLLTGLVLVALVVTSAMMEIIQSSSPYQE